MDIIKVVAWACICSVAAGLSVTTASNATPAKPQIRIAYLYGKADHFTVIQYLIAKMNVNRTILPDYDITIDAYPIEEDIFQGPVEVTKILQDSTPTYHAIAGPRSRKDTMEIADMAAAARVLHVHRGDSPSLSDRQRYPYTFRVLRSVQGVLASWFFIAKSNNWPAVASVWSDLDTHTAADKVAHIMNVSNFPILAENSQSQWSIEAWQIGLVNQIRASHVRVVMLYTDLLIGWQSLCRVHRARLSGIQYFVPVYWGIGWFLQDFPAALGDCTVDEIYSAVIGHIVGFHTSIAPGVSLLGQFRLPPIGGDQSQAALGCAPSITTDTLINGAEHLGLALSSGSFWDEASAVFYVGRAATQADEMCALLLSLHDALYSKEVPLASIAAREEVAFQKLVESMESLDFQGASGRLRFYEDTGDPVYIYVILNQMALPFKGNLSTDTTALAIFPNGPMAEPVIHLLKPEIDFVWRDGSHGLGPNAAAAGLYPDCEQENGVLVWDACEPCPPGTLYDTLLKDCRTCPLGQYQNESGSSSCITAPPGFFISDVAAPLVAVLCPEGHECPQAGTVVEQPCARGRFAAAPGQAACKLCLKGTYQQDMGASNCSRCEDILVGSTTASIASVDAEACICPSGTYWLLADGNPELRPQCADCPEGMVCPEGSNMNNFYDLSASSSKPFPLVKPGYMTRVSSPLEVFLCNEVAHCPGGHPGTCAKYRDAATVACGDCVEGAYDTGQDCSECGDAAMVPVVIAGIAAVTLVMVTTIVVNRDIHKTPAASFMIIAVIGLLFASIQALGLFSQMAIPWEEPVKSVMELAQLLSFDLKLLKMACIMGVNPLRSFALQQTTPVAAVPCMWFALLLKKYLPRVGHRKVRLGAELANTIGTVYSVFFISIVIAAMDPFICYRHPGDAGESVRSAPALLCFEGGEHTSMMIISVVALCLLPIPFLCLCIVGTIMYTSTINSYSSHTFLHAMRFLFFRYTPQRYYFQIVVLLRSLLLCLIPAAVRGRVSTQVLLMSVLLCCYVLLVEEMRPWRAKLCTSLDASMTTLLVTMLICGALFLGDTPQTEAVSYLATAVLASLLSLGVLAVLYGLRRRLLPRPVYDFFICHHKAHAAAQARYLKCLLQVRRRKAEVFIDSDNLQELDTLFDIVRTRVKHLVVFLTSDTLKRPWCAGEIVTALRSQLVVTRLQTPAFAAPSEEQYAQPDKYLDTSGCNLSEYSIHWNDIIDAYKRFLGPQVPYLDLSATVLGTRRFDLAAAKLLKQRSGVEQLPSLQDVWGDSVLILTNATSDEANAAGGVLLSLVSENVYRECDARMVVLADYLADLQQSCSVAQSAAVGVVMLSAGCLQSLQFVSVICELMIRLHNPACPPAVISVNTPSFDFPAPRMLQSLCKTLPDLDLAYAGQAADHLKSFFKRISVAFPTHASQQALDSQAAEVFRRIQAHLKNRGVKATASIDTSSDAIITHISTGKRPFSPVRHSGKGADACYRATSPQSVSSALCTACPTDRVPPLTEEAEDDDIMPLWSPSSSFDSHTAFRSHVQHHVVNETLAQHGKVDVDGWEAPTQPSHTEAADDACASTHPTSSRPDPALFSMDQDNEDHDVVWSQTWTTDIQKSLHNPQHEESRTPILHQQRHPCLQQHSPDCHDDVAFSHALSVSHQHIDVPAEACDDDVWSPSMWTAIGDNEEDMEETRL